MWFTKFEVGDFILAPRPRYSISKLQLKPNLNTSASSKCANCGSNPIDDWDIVITVNCIGNGDLGAARVGYNGLVNFVAQACRTNKLRMVLQYCNEVPLEYDITGGYVQPIEPEWALDCCDSATLVAELHMTGLEIDTTNNPDVTIYNYVVYTP